MDLINEALVIIVLATTGNGDFPTSALSFWRFLLRSDLPVDILSDVTFATFGLGDSSYARFCWPARKLNKRLQGLGAYELIPSGEADDQHYLGIDGALRPWLDTLWSTLEHVLPAPAAGELTIPDDQPVPPSMEVRLDNRADKGALIGSLSTAETDVLDPGWRWARLTKNQRITASDHWQDVRLIEFEDAKGEKIDYRPTDVLSLVPENSDQDVERILDRLGWAGMADERLEVRPASEDVRIPNKLAYDHRLTLRRLFAVHLDFKGVPRPSFFERILPFAPAEHMQHEKLQEYCTPGEGADEMYEYAIRVRRTMLEVLEEFDAVQIPLRYVLDVFPLMRRREFSIASAPSHHGKAIQLAIAIVDYKTRLKDRRKGVCTAWLAQLQEGAHVPLQIKPSAMATQALQKHSTPAIFVGPGTGVAPIRSALWTRYAEHSSADGNGMRAEDNVCFFGCRNRSKDYLFAVEWDRLAAEQCIEAHLAASRDQADKLYVQDLIGRHPQRVWDVVGVGAGLVYICGSAGKMPQAVRAAIVHVCQTHGGLAEEEAEGHVERMEREGRWIEECWD